MANYTYEESVRLPRGRPEHARPVECRVKDLAPARGAYGCVLFLSRGETEVLGRVECAAEGGDFPGTGGPGPAPHREVLTRADWRAVS
jgi:hypothetical protein